METRYFHLWQFYSNLYIMSSEKFNSEDFLTVSDRIKAELKMRKDKELIEALEVPQGTFSRRKSDPFPVEWAFKISRKFGLLTEWIMTGEGPKRLPQPHSQNPDAAPTRQRAKFLDDLETWAREISETENISWLEKQLETCLPTWKIWREQNKSGAAAETRAPIHEDQVTRRVA